MDVGGADVAGQTFDGDVVTDLALALIQRERRVAGGARPTRRDFVLRAQVRSERSTAGVGHHGVESRKVRPMVPPKVGLAFGGALPGFDNGLPFQACRRALRASAGPSSVP